MTTHLQQQQFTHRDSALMLRALRLAAGMSQPQLAHRLNVKPQRVNALERGREPAGQEIFTRIVRAVGVDPISLEHQLLRVAAERDRDGQQAIKDAASLRQSATKLGRVASDHPPRTTRGNRNDYTTAARRTPSRRNITTS